MIHLPKHSQPNLNRELLNQLHIFNDLVLKIYDGNEGWRLFRKVRVILQPR